jgi:hypothetical protein
MAEDASIRAFAAKQLEDSATFDFFISDKRHCVFRFAFASTFFNIFLFRSSRVITIANTASFLAIFENRSFLIRFSETHDVLTHALLARTHFEHFRRDDESFMAIQGLSEQEQRSQTKSTSIS